MGIFDEAKSMIGVGYSPKKPIAGPEQNGPQNHGGFGSFADVYSGERNPGELGPAKIYFVDHYTLRARAWQYYLESGITRMVIDKFLEWVIGSGLQLQSTPVESILEGINGNIRKFRDQVEPRFRMYAESKRASYEGMETLHEKAYDAVKSCIIGGDCLIVKRIKNGRMTVQVIDGSFIMNPPGTAFDRRMDHGVELDSKGRHVAFWVRVNSGGDINNFKRIPATGGKSGMQFAYMVYGKKYTPHDNRGLSIISSAIESIRKLDRYRDAALGSAEERQKFPYVISHDGSSDGTDPRFQAVANALNYGDDEMPEDDKGEQLANKVTASMQKQTFNMPKGAKMESLESKNESYFRDFYSALSTQICAEVGIPAEVAFSKFEQNFSSSRASLKQWEHTMEVWGHHYGGQLYQPIYSDWLFLSVIDAKVNAPGYMDAWKNNNFDILEAYQKSQFLGPQVPHIDPVKEAQSARLKLGGHGKNTPLISMEKATREVRGGEFQKNIEKFEQERNLGDKHGIDFEEKETSSGPSQGQGDGNSSNAQGDD